MVGGVTPILVVLDSVRKQEWEASSKQHSSIASASTPASTFLLV